MQLHVSIHLLGFFTCISSQLLEEVEQKQLFHSIFAELIAWILSVVLCSV